MNVTMKQLEEKLLRINTQLGRPTRPWVDTATGTKPAIGCIFLDNAYSGYSIREMVASGGERVVVIDGYYPRKEIAQQLDALQAGISLEQMRETTNENTA